MDLASRWRWARFPPHANLPALVQAGRRQLANFDVTCVDMWLAFKGQVYGTRGANWVAGTNSTWCVPPGGPDSSTELHHACKYLYASLHSCLDCCPAMPCRPVLPRFAFRLAFFWAILACLLYHYFYSTQAFAFVDGSRSLLLHADYCSEKPKPSYLATYLPTPTPSLVYFPTSLPTCTCLSVYPHPDTEDMPCHVMSLSRHVTHPSRPPSVPSVRPCV